MARDVHDRWGGSARGQAVFGICQGGLEPDLRRDSARFVAAGAPWRHSARCGGVIPAAGLRHVVYGAPDRNPVPGAIVLITAQPIASAGSVMAPRGGVSEKPTVTLVGEMFPQRDPSEDMEDEDEADGAAAPAANASEPRSGAAKAAAPAHPILAKAEAALDKVQKELDVVAKKATAANSTKEPIAKVKAGPKLRIKSPATGFSAPIDPPTKTNKLIASGNCF